MTDLPLSGIKVIDFTWIVAGMISNPKHVLDWFDNLPMVP